MLTWIIMQNLIRQFENKKIGVICHDAGAANILLPFIKKIVSNSLKVFVSGPALVSAKKCEFNLVSHFDDVFVGIDCLITGTGWSTDLEHEARVRAHQNAIYSIAFIDHWVNYPDRFIRNGLIQYPDKFWVSDNYAFDIAKKIFIDSTVEVIPNFYIDELVSLVRPVSEISPYNILYVMEPMRNDWGRRLSGEFQAFQYFLENLGKVINNDSYHIKIRPHPSDEFGKYNDLINKASQSFKVSLDCNVDLLHAISESSIVVGCESYALVAGVAAGRRVFSSLPPWAPACRLPHREITHLSKV